MILRGEVYWTDHRGAVGAEVRKTRPCVVVSNDRHNAHTGTVTVVPLSSGEPRPRYDEVELPAGTLGDGRPARIKAHQIRAVDKSRLGEKLGVLPMPLMARLDAALRVHLGLRSPGGL